jgi:hypothetical protein
MELLDRAGVGVEKTKRHNVQVLILIPPTRERALADRRDRDG